MEFFISCSHSDPIFSEFYSDCSVLISPCNTKKYFNLGIWKRQPKQVIIDSSAFYYLSTKKNLPTQKVIFYEQLRVSRNAKCPVILSPLDNPIGLDSTDSSKVYLAIEKTLGNAYEFLELYTRNNLHNDPLFTPMAVIQGTDKLSIQFCSNELKKLGFKKFGLGSLAPLFNPVEILNRVQYAADIVGGENLHLFGISRIDIIPDLKTINIMSIDSSRPIKAAIFNAIFYSNPFRTYGIHGAKNSTSYSRLIENPFTCNCPICENDSSILIKTGRKKYTNARAIHNYFHLIQHIKGNAE